MTFNDLDKIHIRDLKLQCIIGINPEEREVKQDVVINVTMYADLRNPCGSDDIDDTVDYKAVKKEILAHVEDSSCHLVENLADLVARICLRTPGVEKVNVSVDKPGALRYARSVAVEIERVRPDYE